MSIFKSITTNGLMLGLFAIVTATLLAVTANLTSEKIEANVKISLQKKLYAVLPEGSHDNDVINDTIQISDKALSQKQITVYRARKNGSPTTAIIPVTAPDGYNGSIQLIVGIHTDGKISGVRVVNHRETPGLGDKIDEKKSDWIHSFTNLSLSQPNPSQWMVKKDGGAIDQFTGATITPRAVVGIVYKTLTFFSLNKEELFQESPSDNLKNDDSSKQ